MRLGIFGGSFDPIHHGHISLATCCLQQARLDEVWFTPAARQPFKQAGPQAPDEDRCAMISLALRHQPKFRLCRLEIDRGGTSYTAETLQTIRAERPHDRLFFLMGADTLRDIPKWYLPNEICRLATPLVAARAGEPAPQLDVLKPLLRPTQWQDVEQLRIKMPALPISSTKIRRRIADGESIAPMVPAQVAAYIAGHHLYQVEP